MRCANSYQDIETPEEMEEENTYESIYERLLEEFDPEEAAENHCSYASYRANCARRARYAVQRMQEEVYQDEEN